MGKMSSLVQCVVTRYTEFIVYFPCGIDPYHAAALLNLKRGWTGINNVLKINYAFLRWRVHCLCPSSLVSNPKCRVRDKGLSHNPGV